MNQNEEYNEVSELCRNIYKAKCQQHGIDPHRNVLSMLGTARLDVRYMNVGPLAGLAIVESLKDNTLTEFIDLNGNGLGCRTICILMLSLQNNGFISTLIISNNDLKLECMKQLGKILSNGSSVESLDISENNLGDMGIFYLTDGLKGNRRLKELRISKNKIGTNGVTYIGELLKHNHSLNLLDLSWNEIRGDAAYHFGLCLSKNKGLIDLDLSWNGFAEDGSLGLEKCLASNNTLSSLNLKSNRINFESLYRLCRGLRKNHSLKILKIGLNNLTLAGVLDIMDVANSSNSGLELVDLEGQYIHSKVLYLIEKINRFRSFTVIYDKILDMENEIYNAKQKDPMEFLIEYLADRAFRVVDFFRMIDKNGEGEISRNEFIKNMKKIHVPLTNKEMQKVVSIIDDERSGTISYGKLIQKLRSYQKEMRERETTKKTFKEQQERKVEINSHIARLFESGQFEGTKYQSARTSASFQSKRDPFLPPLSRAAISRCSKSVASETIPTESRNKDYLVDLDKITTIVNTYSK